MLAVYGYERGLLRGNCVRGVWFWGTSYVLFGVKIILGEKHGRSGNKLYVLLGVRLMQLASL